MLRKIRTSRIAPDLVDRYYNLLRREGNRQATIDRQTGPSEPVLDGRLHEIRAPVLIEWGARDRWIPLDLGRRLHDGIAGSTMVIYGDVGHMPMEEIPEASSVDAEEFLNMLGQSTHIPFCGDQARPHPAIRRSSPVVLSGAPRRCMSPSTLHWDLE